MKLNETVNKKVKKIFLGCVHIDTSMCTGPGFCLWPTEASLIRVERSRSLLQAHNSAPVGHIE